MRILLILLSLEPGCHSGRRGVARIAATGGGPDGSGTWLEEARTMVVCSRRWAAASEECSSHAPATPGGVRSEERAIESLRG
jgi:hypothetical protein